MDPRCNYTPGPHNSWQVGGRREECKEGGSACVAKAVPVGSRRSEGGTEICVDGGWQAPGPFLCFLLWPTLRFSEATASSVLGWVWIGAPAQRTLHANHVLSDLSPSLRLRIFSNLTLQETDNHQSIPATNFCVSSPQSSPRPTAFRMKPSSIKAPFIPHTSPSDLLEFSGP